MIKPQTTPTRETQTLLRELVFGESPRWHYERWTAFKIADDGSLLNRRMWAEIACQSGGR